MLAAEGRHDRLGWMRESAYLVLQEHSFSLFSSRGAVQKQIILVHKHPGQHIQGAPFGF